MDYTIFLIDALLSLSKMKVLDFLYYRLYKFIQRTTLKDIAPPATCTYMSMLLSINFIVIVDNLGINLLEMAPAKVLSLIVCGGMIVFFYFLFVRSKRYLRLEAYYANESKKERVRGNLILLAYVVGTILALLFLT
jgi:hypothetical protein